MSLRRFILAVLAGIVLTAVLGLIGGIMSGGGHNMIPPIIVFPYLTYLIFGMQIEQIPAVFGLFLSCIPFVAYAVLLANARSKRQVIYISALLLILHTLAVIFSYSAYRASETVGRLQNPAHKIYDGDFTLLTSKNSIIFDRVGVNIYQD